MKVLRCHIVGFGKMRNVECTLKEGMNLLDAPNGWGKTTFALFILSMLYGLKDVDSTGSILKQVRKLYAPRDGAQFGGYLIFEAGGTRYRAVRSFGMTEAEDTFGLYFDMTGKLSGDYTENLGLELFGVDSGAYSRSAFISHHLEDVIYGVHLNEYLLNLVESEQDADSYDDALERITEEERRLTRGGTRNVPEAVEAVKSTLSSVLKMASPAAFCTARRLCQPER